MVSLATGLEVPALESPKESRFVKVNGSNGFHKRCSNGFENEFQSGFQMAQSALVSGPRPVAEDLGSESARCFE